MMIGVFLSCSYPGSTHSQDALIIQPRNYGTQEYRTPVPSYIKPNQWVTDLEKSDGPCERNGMPTGYKWIAAQQKWVSCK
jgi:hypothetical protein